METGNKTQNINTINAATVIWAILLFAQKSANPRFIKNAGTSIIAEIPRQRYMIEGGGTDSIGQTRLKKNIIRNATVILAVIIDDL
jgi:hypothetical protein